MTIAKLMSVVLIASLGSRAGEARSRLYTAMEHMQYKHIELMIVSDGKPRFENLKAHIITEFAKGKKDLDNMDDDAFMHPLDDPRQHHMCPITLLLVHALRHGLVRGSTVQEVLDHAMDAADSKVVWLYPNRPVLAAFTSKSTRELDLDKPAGIDQTLQSIKQMGIVSNVLSRVYIHATRLGTARDVAHLPAVDGAGFTDNVVRQSLGRTNSALNSGITENYVGSHTRELYNDRATTQFQSRWGAKFSESSATDLIKAPVTEDIRQWQNVNEPSATDKDSKKARRRAQNGVRRDRQKTFIATAPPEKKTHAKEIGAANGKGKLSQRSASDVNAAAGKKLSKKSGHEAQSSASMTKSSEVAVDLSKIDQRLLDEDALESMRIDAVDFGTLENDIIVTNDPSVLKPESNIVFEEESDVTETYAFFHDLDTRTDEELGAEGFILKYSRINIVSKNILQENGSIFKRGLRLPTALEDMPQPVIHAMLQHLSSTNAERHSAARSPVLDSMS